MFYYKVRLLTNRHFGNATVKNLKRVVFEMCLYKYHYRRNINEDILWCYVVPDCIKSISYVQNLVQDIDIDFAHLFKHLD